MFSAYLSQGFRVRTHVGEDDEHVLLALVRQELGRREGDARSDDSLDAVIDGTTSLRRIVLLQTLNKLTLDRWPNSGRGKRFPSIHSPRNLA